MKNALLEFETLVFLRLVTPANQRIAETDLYKSRISQAQKLIEDKISELLQNTESERLISATLRFYRQRLIEMADRVYHHKAVDDLIIPEIPDSESTRSELIGSLVISIDNILDYIAYYGKPYISSDIKMPDYLVDKRYMELQMKFKPVSDYLKTVPIPEFFLTALTDYLNNIETSSGKIILYYDIDYAFKLFTALTHCISSDERNDINIAQLFIELNFNKRSILNDAKNWIQHFVTQRKDDPQLLALLIEMKKHVQMQEQSTKWYYSQERINIKDHLIDLLNIEIEWLVSDEHKFIVEKAAAKDEYIIFDTTIKQIDLWAAISVKLNLIPFHSPNQVIRIVSRFVRTLHSGPIDYNNARKKAGEIDDPSVKGLHNILSRQVKFLEEEYPHLFKCIILLLYCY